VSWADRIAYVCHDWEDAVSAGIVTPDDLPEPVRRRCGTRRSSQLGEFVGAVVGAVTTTGRVGMDEETAEALAAFRRCNYERVYLRPASLTQGAAVIAVLRALVEHFADQPGRIPDVRRSGGLASGGPEALHAAVEYVAGMTDRYAMACATADLGWDPARLPRGVDEVGAATGAP